MVVDAAPAAEPVMVAVTSPPPTTAVARNVDCWPLDRDTVVRKVLVCVLPGDGLEVEPAAAAADEVALVALGEDADREGELALLEEGLMMAIEVVGEPAIVVVIGEGDGEDDGEGDGDGDSEGEGEGEFEGELLGDGEGEGVETEVIITTVWLGVTVTTLVEGDGSELGELLPVGMADCEDDGPLDDNNDVGKEDEGDEVGEADAAEEVAETDFDAGVDSCVGDADTLLLLLPSEFWRRTRAAIFVPTSGSSRRESSRGALLCSKDVCWRFPRSKSSRISGVVVDWTWLSRS